MPAAYTFALETSVVENVGKKPAPRFATVDVRFGAVTTQLKVSCRLSGAALLEKLRSVLKNERIEHVEVNGRVVAKLVDMIDFKDGDVIVVAPVEELVLEEERIPCDRCGVAIAVSLYLEHERQCGGGG